MPTRTADGTWQNLSQGSTCPWLASVIFHAAVYYPRGGHNGQLLTHRLSLCAVLVLQNLSRNPEHYSWVGRLGPQVVRARARWAPPAKAAPSSNG